jgi:hypothetical protein
VKRTLRIAAIDLCSWGLLCRVERSIARRRCSLSTSPPGSDNFVACAIHRLRSNEVSWGLPGREHPLAGRGRLVCFDCLSSSRRLQSCSCSLLPGKPRQFGAAPAEKLALAIIILSSLEALASRREDIHGRAIYRRGRLATATRIARSITRLQFTGPSPRRAGGRVI